MKKKVKYGNLTISFCHGKQNNEKKIIINNYWNGTINVKIKKLVLF